MRLTEVFVFVVLFIAIIDQTTGQPRRWSKSEKCIEYRNRKHHNSTRTSEPNNNLNAEGITAISQNEDDALPKKSNTLNCGRRINSRQPNMLVDETNTNESPNISIVDDDNIENPEISSGVGNKKRTKHNCHRRRENKLRNRRKNRRSRNEDNPIAELDDKLLNEIVQNTPEDHTV